MTKIDWKSFFINFWLILLTGWLTCLVTFSSANKIHEFNLILLYGGIILGFSFLIFLFIGIIRLLLLNLLKFVLPLIILLIVIYCFIKLFNYNWIIAVLYTVTLVMFLILIKRYIMSTSFKKRKVTPDWLATKQQNPQGADVKLFKINSGGLLKKLNFSVISESPYWRAGLKFVSPRSTLFPLLSDKSFLIHVGRNSPEDKLSLHLYHDGKKGSDKSKHENLQYESYKPVHISIERNKKNHVYFKVNDELVYEKRFNPELFKKVYLMAWGDSNDFVVSFKDINYEVE